MPITQTWRDELIKLTAAANLKTNNYTNVTAYQLPPGSRQGDRPPPSRNGEVPPSRNGERPPPSRQASRQGERLQSRLGSRQGQKRAPIQEEHNYQHIVPYPDNENQVSCNLLWDFHWNRGHRLCSWDGMGAMFLKLFFWNKSWWKSVLRPPPPPPPMQLQGIIYFNL